MTEVFGIAAGAVGVVSLSIQLAESLQKVKSFYAGVKNAPLQVAELIEEIEIMQDILSDLEASSQTVASNSNMKRCINAAQRATKSFASFSEELQASIKKRRYRGSARFALSRDDIKQMLDQLERTKSSLNLAYSLYQQATAEDRHIVVMQALSSSQPSMVQITHKSQGTLSRQDSFALTHSNPQVGRKSSVAGKKLFCITTPTWLRNTIWQLEMRRSIAGFNIFVRTFGVVPLDAPIFEACAKGNIAEMQRMFDSGLASPYDKDEHGMSLWSHALTNVRKDSLRFLSRHYTAADQLVSLVVFYRVAIALRLEKKWPVFSAEYNMRDAIAWLRDISDEADQDGRYTLNYHPSKSRALQFLACPLEDLDSVGFWHALEDCSGIMRLLPFSDQLIKEMLDRYKSTNHNGKLPLQLLVVPYGASVTWHLRTTDIGRGFPDGPIRKELACSAHWLDYLEKTLAIVISRGANIHEADQCHTPLLLFLTGCLGYKFWGHFEVRPGALRRRLLFWLRTLQRAGVDLARHGAEESRAFEKCRSLEESIMAVPCWHHEELLAYAVDLPSFTFFYGPRPEDWTVELDLPVEEYASEFWQMPGLYDEWATKAVPGSWTGD